MTTSTTLTTWDDMPPSYRAALERQGVANQEQADAMTTAAVRLAIRVVTSEVDELRIGRHPAGVGAIMGRNYKTDAVRAWVRDYLKVYYRGGISERINSREDSATVGMPLADRFVTALEFGNALRSLGQERPDLIPPLEVVFKYPWPTERLTGNTYVDRQVIRKRHRWTMEQAANHLNIDVKTLRSRLTDAYNCLIELIWRDEVVA